MLVPIKFIYRLKAALMLATGLLAFALTAPAQTSDEDAVAVPSRFRVGEKLSYTLTFSNLTDAGHAEFFVASRGTIGGVQAVEIRSRVKTFGLVSAAFLQVDESRTVYAAPDTSLPVYVSKVSHLGAVPRESIANYLTVPTSNYDLVTLLYKLRDAGGVGTYTVREGERVYSISFQTGVSERVETDAGTFDTTVSTADSEFLTFHGIKNLRINWSSDDSRLPVMLRFRTNQGEFRAVLSAVIEPEPAAAIKLPVVAATPLPTPVKRPTPVAEVYVNNKPLAAELGFQIGEALDYRVTAGGRPAGVITLSAVERKLFEKEDSLLLQATVTEAAPGNAGLSRGDFARAQVNPETLAPKWVQTRFSSPFLGTKQVVRFDAKSGQISFSGPKPIDAPIGTHSLLSLIYAMRSFNLKPSKDPGNPVNDTRVAVFWESQPYIFTLRPSNSETIEINGEKVTAQLITVNTGTKELDALGIKVWLGTEDRVPLRFVAGAYQADLVSSSDNS